jgi:hypothetical protein
MDAVNSQLSDVPDGSESDLSTTSEPSWPRNGSSAALENRSAVGLQEHDKRATVSSVANSSENAFDSVPIDTDVQSADHVGSLNCEDEAPSRHHSAQLSAAAAIADHQQETQKTVLLKASSIQHTSHSYTMTESTVKADITREVAENGATQRTGENPSPKPQALGADVSASVEVPQDGMIGVSGASSIQHTSHSYAMTEVTVKTDITSKLAENGTTQRSAEHLAPKPQAVCADVSASGEVPQDGVDGQKELHSSSGAQWPSDVGVQAPDTPNAGMPSASVMLGNKYAAYMLRDASLRSASLKRGNTTTVLHGNLSQSRSLGSNANLSGSLSARCRHPQSPD